MKTTIWVIDDDPIDSDRALSILKIINRVTIKSSDNWDWPPDFIDHKQSLKSQLPDVVVLDLHPDIFRVEKFYTKLREAELNSQNLHKSFVIIWSVRGGVPGGNAFIKKYRTSDNHFIESETKSSYDLEIAINGCLRRIIEERM